MKAKVKCPVCDSPNQHVYTVPGHPELKAPRIEIINPRYKGVSICKLVACAECGAVYDWEIANRIQNPEKKQPEVAG